MFTPRYFWPCSKGNFFALLYCKLQFSFLCYDMQVSALRHAHCSGPIVSDGQGRPWDRAWQGHFCNRVHATWSRNRFAIWHDTSLNLFGQNTSKPCIRAYFFSNHIWKCQKRKLMPAILSQRYNSGNFLNQKSKQKK